MRRSRHAYRRPDDDTGHPWHAAFVTAALLAPAGGAVYAGLHFLTDLSDRHALGLALGVMLVPAFLALFWPRGVAGRISAVWKLLWLVVQGLT